MAVSFCALAGVLSSAILAMPPEELNAWQADLEVYEAEIVARHIDPFTVMTEERFRQELDNLRGALPAIDRDQAVARLMRLHHQIGDGHTSIPLWDFGYHRYPVEFQMVDGQVFIAAIGADQARALGAVVTAIDGRDIADVVAEVASHAPFVENAGSRAVRIARYMSVAELMSAIGLAEHTNRAIVTLRDNQGAFDIQLRAVESSQYTASLEQRLEYRRTFVEEDVLASAPGLSFSYLAAAELGYIRFDYYPSMEQMTEFGSAVRSIMERENGRNLVIDFRENYGGNFYVGLMLAHELNLLDGVDWAHGVYVLTGQITFSAAMSNAAQFSDILNARRVGEPTGATPCGFQDMGSFNLPNSGLLVTYSKRHFCFAEPVGDALPPDHPVAVTLEHWRDGHDAALEWVLEDIASR